MYEHIVYDMNRATKWYQDILGFNVIFKGGDCHTEFALPVKGTRLALSLTTREHQKGKARGRLFINVTNINQIEASLQEKNVKIEPIFIIPGVVKILWVEDSEGNYFAFEESLNRTDKEYNLK